MFNFVSQAVNPGLTAAVVAFLVTPVVIKLAWKFGLIDDPKKNNHPKIIHSEPVPRAGGLALYLGILISILIFIPLDQHIIGILIGATIIVIYGLIDDKWNLNPYVRLGLQFSAAAVPIYAGIGIASINNPFGGILDLSQPRIEYFLFGEARSIWILSDLFALFWIVSVMNFLNMGAKGVDGQLSGTVAIAAIIISILSLKFSADITQWPVITLATITAGAFLGFLPWHLYPQKIMPSFSGSNLGGYLLAILAIFSTTKIGTLLVVLGIPFIDTGYTITRRILSGKSPVWGDRGHLHHRLLDSGWTKSKITLFYWLISIILGTLALYLNTSFKFYTMVGIALFVGGLILWLIHQSKS